MIEFDLIMEGCGGMARLAKTLGISRVAVWKWKKLGRIPLRHLPAVELLTGYSCEQLRPDIYPHRRINTDNPISGG